MNLPELVNTRLDGTARAIASLRRQVPVVTDMIRAVTECLGGGGRLYTCGNGGSAAEAMHLAEELVGRYRGSRGPLPAMCLNADPTALTCIANDFGYAEVFARQCAALLTPADTLLVLTTSGRSPNLVRALEVARERGATTLGLLGKGGGGCRPLCDHAIVIEGDDSAHTQEAHLVVVHLICEALEG